MLKAAVVSRADGATTPGEAAFNSIRSIKAESTSEPHSGFYHSMYQYLHIEQAYRAVVSRPVHYNALCVSSILGSPGIMLGREFRLRIQKQQQPREKALFSSADEALPHIRAFRLHESF